MDSPTMKVTVPGYFDRAFDEMADTPTTRKEGTSDWVTPNAERRTANVQR